MNFYQRNILPKLLDLLMRKKSSEKDRPAVVGEASGIVLEIGFGSGLNLPFYENVSKLYALDPSRKLYEIAAENVKKASFPVEYIQASAESIPLSDNSVDVIVSTWTLCSIPRSETALKEMFRVLKPGGKFSFIEHGKSPKGFIARLQKTMTPISACLARGCHMDREIDKLIIEAGFKLKKIDKSEPKLKPLAFTYKGLAVARK